MDSDPLIDYSLTDWAVAIKTGEITAHECLQLHLQRIKDTNPILNAIVTLNPGAAADAAAADQARAENQVLGPLHGVPFSVKDTFDTQGLRTTAGTLLLSSHIPQHSATAVKRLQDAGAVLVGKSNCSEFAVATHTSNPLFGETLNPWDTSLTSGGSTGGESAAVTSGMSAFGLGTDFGGSIRWPAHCTGLVGMRPTVGLVPQTGLQPHALEGPRALPNSMSLLNRFSSVSWLARSVKDLDVLLRVLAGPDGLDSSTVPVPLADPVYTLDGLSCAWFEDEGTYPVRADLVAVVEKAATALERHGVPTTHQRPPGIDRAAAAFIAMRTAEGMPDVVRIAQGREEELSENLRSSLLRSEPVLVTGYRQAAAERDFIQAEVLEFMKDENILLLPVACVPASDPHQSTFRINDVDIPWTELGSCCRAISILGFPVVVVPCGLSEEGLPVGVQIVGRPFHDHEVLAVARTLENEFGRFSPPPINELIK